MGGYVWTILDESEKKIAVDLVNENFLGKTEEIIVANEPLNIFLIADGTGSRYTKYAIPELDSTFIANVIKKVHMKDGGKVWLTHVDNVSKNNSVYYLPVDPILEHSVPIRKNGETSFAFSSRLANWKNQRSNFSKDSLANEIEFFKSTDQFIQKCQKLLGKVYTKGTPENQWTDIIGILNSAITTLEQLDHNDGRKIIVCFSDMEQDAPYLKPEPVLRDIPVDITILVVNPALGSSKKVTDQVIEIEHTSRVYELCFVDP